MNSTLALTLMLLSLMFGAVIVSASWGYALGREALKGITQPDVRPTGNFSNAPDNASDAPPLQEELLIIPEDKILEDVKAKMAGQAGADASAPSSQSLLAQGKAIASTNPDQPSDDSSSSNHSNRLPFEDVAFVDSSSQFPIKTQSQGVTLEVFAVRQQGNELSIEFSIENQSNQHVQFYDEFLRITDRNGRLFDADLSGLPEQIRPDSGLVMGTISIPSMRLYGGNSLSLTFTNYPDQDIQLQISDIPISR
ncbi:MAG: hypothetical protein ACFE0J_18085 [Elainellaceae cyanobacterium]